MATFAPVIQAIDHAENYSDKAQLANYLLHMLERKKRRLVKEDAEELATFIFRETETMMVQIPLCQSYKEKDVLFEYENSLMGVLTHCYASPEEMPPEELAKITVLAAKMKEEQFIETAIDEVFEEDTVEAADIDRLVKLAGSAKDEYQKGQLYKGLLHYEEKLEELPEVAEQRLAAYMESELIRYKNEALDEDRIDNLEIAVDLCKHVLNEALVEQLYAMLKLGYTNICFYAAQTLLGAGRMIPDTTIEALARDMEYANLTYRMLEAHQQADRFPSELATPEYLAESDMVHWLVFPTELGKKPDAIEYLGKVKKKELYHVFRFRSDSDNLDEELQGKWLIGWASEEGGTFSNFDEYARFEKKTPEKTLRYIRRKLL